MERTGPGPGDKGECGGVGETPRPRVLGDDVVPPSPEHSTQGGVEMQSPEVKWSLC